MASDLRERRRWLAWTGATGVGLMAVLFVLLNILGNWFSLRWDLTEGQTYSLSPATRHLLKDIDDRVVIKAYFTPQLPPPYNVYRDYIRELLQEYRRVSHGKVAFEFVSTRDSRSFEMEASRSGLAPLTFEEAGSNNVQIKRGFMGLKLFYRDRSEVLPAVQDIRGAEYDITMRLARMTRKSKKRILFTAGHGESSWMQVPAFAPGRDLSELFEIKQGSLTATAPVDADAVFVVGPKERFDEKSLQAIDQVVQRGTPVAFFIDTKKISLGEFSAQEFDAGFFGLLGTYGVNLGRELVVDVQCENVAMSQSMNGMAFTTNIRYPFVPLISRFPPYHPLFRGIDAIGVLFPSKLNVSSGTTTSVKSTPLMFTSPKSWLTGQDLWSVAPTSIRPPSPNQPMQSYSVAFLLEGSFPSPFGTGAVSAANKLFVMGTSYLWDPQLPSFTGVPEFLINLAAVMTHDETLIGIRRKNDIVRPLHPTSAFSVFLVRYGSMFGAPLLMGLLGLFLWRRRQAWRRRVTQTFAIVPPAEV